MKKIIVVGGGAGGLIFANRMVKEFSSQISEKELSIKVIEGSPYHEFQPAYLAVAFRGKNPEDIRRPVASLILPGVELVTDYCSKIDLDNRFVETSKKGRRHEFDEIVIATGSKPDYSLIPGLKEANMDFHTSAHESARVFKAISSFKSGKIVSGIGGLPYKCPPSPNESAFMLDEFFTRKNMRDKVSITYITPFLRSYSAETVNEVIEPIYKERNIDVVTSFNIDYVEPSKKELVSLEGDTLSYDSLMLVPPHTGVDLIKGTEFADEDGWIYTDKQDLHIKDYDYAFAIGDATNIPISKAGVEAHLEAIVVANNMISKIKGYPDNYEFTGRLQCSMETGYHQATFVIGTYDKPIKKIQPSFYNYIQKKLMERIYWASMKGGYEWLFKRHFGEDYYRKTTTNSPSMKSAKAEGN